MGIDIELMTDTREFSVKSSSLEVQAQLDLFPVIFPIWLPFIWPVVGNSENTYAGGNDHQSDQLSCHTG